MSKLSFAKRLLLTCLTAVCAFSYASAQDITPVDVDAKKPEQPRLHYYDEHGDKLPEPVYFLTQTDTVKKASPKSPWPLFNGVTVGVNFFDAALLIAGQTYASFNASVAVSLHNWFFPTLEAGLGFANRKEEGTEMIYRTPPSPFVKIGLDYNFLYKSSPDYMVGVGVRCGWASPSYKITGGEVTSGYWDQTSPINIYNQKVTAWYGEALATVKVKIWKALSMGWSVRYRFKFKISNSTNSSPWFIPGYGASAPISATFSLMYTFGGTTKLPVVVEE